MLWCHHGAMLVAVPDTVPLHDGIVFDDCSTAVHENGYIRDHRYVCRL